jgi:glycosyltransferase involved in cell wall biosynthesis
VESTQTAFERLREAGSGDYGNYRLAGLAGRPYTGETLDSTAVVMDLDYALNNPKPNPRQLLSDLRSSAHEALGGKPDVWHFHNHSLGKNKAIPEVVATLAEEGEAMLLHLHDFAEDGRPENYREIRESIGDLHKLYPHSPRVRYAVLNGRDYRHLKAAGLPADRLHLLSNPVEVDDCAPAASGEAGRHPELENLLGERRLFLYPVRALRRKNFGELCLWATLADPEQTVFANTLGPTNPRYEKRWRRWKELAEQLDLPVHFGLGSDLADVPFPSLIAAAEGLVSVSVGEGFGLAFLEPWLFGKPLFGRNLPGITEDFAEAGVELASLYERLEVPVAWVGEDRLRKRIAEALESDYETYREPLPEDAAQQAFASFVRGDQVDFGRLDEPLQENVLEKLAKEPQAREYLQSRVGLIGEELPGDELIQKNREVIAREYSIEAYGKRLAKIYRELDEASPGRPDFLEPRAVLQQFLSPEQLNLLRSSA